MHLAKTIPKTIQKTIPKTILMITLMIMPMIIILTAANIMSLMLWLRTQQESPISLEVSQRNSEMKARPGVTVRI